MDIAGLVKVRVEADIDPLKQGFGAARGETDKFDKEASGKLENVGKSARKSGDEVAGSFRKAAAGQAEFLGVLRRIEASVSTVNGNLARMVVSTEATAQSTARLSAANTAAASSAAATGASANAAATGLGRQGASAVGTAAATTAVANSNVAAATAAAGVASSSVAAATGLTGQSAAAGRAATSMTTVAAANDNAALSYQKVAASAAGATSTMRTLVGVLGPLAALFSVRQLQMFADGWSDMQSRVGSAIRDMDAAPEMMQRIVDIANASYSPLSQTVEVFGRNVAVLRDLGRNATEAADFTEALNHALVTTATKGQDADVVLNSLSRAIATGGLRAMEYETIMSRSPRVLQAIGEQLGTTAVGLRKLAQEGKATGDVIVSGLINSLLKLRKEAAEMPATISDAFTRIGTNLTAVLGQMDKLHGSSETIAAALMMIADDLGTVLAIIGSAVVVLAGRLAGPLVAAQLSAAKAAAAHGAALLSGNAIMINSRHAAELRTTAVAQSALADQVAKQMTLEAAQADLVRARNLYSTAQAGQVAGVSVAQAHANMVASSRAVVIAQSALAASSARSTVAIAAQTVAMRANAFGALAMATASRALGATVALFGGPAGLAFTAIVGTLAYMATRTSDASRAMEVHEQIVGSVRKAYQDAGEATGDWAKKVQEGTLTQAIANLEDFRTQLQAIRDTARAPVDAFGADQRGTVKALEEAVTAFRSGELAADSFKAAVDRIAQADPSLDRTVALQLLKVGDSALDAEEKVGRAEAVMRVLNGTASASDRALLGLANSMSKAAVQAGGFANAMRELGALIPQVAAQQKAQEQLTKATADYQKGLTELRQEQQAGNISAADYLASRNTLIQRYQLARDEVTGLAGATRQLEQAERQAAIGAMSAREAAIARVRDQGETLIKQLRETGAAESEIARATAAMNQELETTSKRFDEIAAKAGAKDLKKTQKEIEDLKKAYDDLVQSAQDFVTQQQLEAGLIGMTEQAANALRYEFDLLNEARRAGIKLTDTDKAGFKALAEAMAEAEERARFLKEAFDFVHGTIKSFFSDLRKGLGEGKSFWESFADAGVNALNKIADKLIDMAFDQLINNVLRNLMGAFNLGGGMGGSGFGNTSYFPPAPSGGFHMLADGGRVSGPGSGTSDSIPAWLSNGEFVVRAAMVSQPGILPLLEAINSGGSAFRMAAGGLARMHGPANGNVQRFSGGGIVRPQPVSQGNAALNLRVDVQNHSSAQVEVGEPKQDGNGDLVLPILINQIKGEIANDIASNGKVGRSIESTYGVRRTTR